MAAYTSERLFKTHTKSPCHVEMSYFRHLSKAQCYQSRMLILEGCKVPSCPPWCKISHRVTLCFLSLDGDRQMGNTTLV